MKDCFTSKKIIKWSLFFLLLIWFAFLYTQPVNITNNDLGRHLANGREITSFLLSPPYEKINILNSNHYSYISPDFYFVNHHWLSSLIFYFIWLLFGFTGLGVFSLIVNLTTLSIFYILAKKESTEKIASVAAFLMIPLIASRYEIRPEIFSYLLLSIIFYILYSYRKNPVNNKIVYFIPLFILLFVNTHIYFILGFFLIGVFGIDAILFGRDNPIYVKKLLLVMLLSLFAGLINPLGYKTLLYPFSIFNNYEIQVVENYSIFEIAKTQYSSRDAIIFVISFCVYLFSFAISMYKNYNKNAWLSFIIIFTFGILSFLMVRNITICALFLIVALSENIGSILKNNQYKLTNIEKKYYALIFMIALIVYGFVTSLKKDYVILNFTPNIEVNQASSFIISNNIKGPMFNDFDSGGYVIFNFFPSIKPFIDNRPEAYPKTFQKDVYLQLLKDEQKWSEVLSQYNFNFIFLRNYDYKKPFTEQRLNDKNWVKVFENKYHLIFLRNSAENQAIIKKYKK